MKKFYVLGMTALLTVSMLTGCGGSSSASDTAENVASEYAATDDIYYGESAKMSEESAADSGSTGETQVVDTNRKLIKTVNMTVETEDYDTLVPKVTNRIQQLGGYIESSDIGKNNSYGEYESQRYANITARIPKAQMEDFVSEVAEASNVISKTESAEDVTLQYVDVESHKKALETEQERLLELLSNAENMEDIITIESKLSEIRYQIESYTSQMRTFDNQVDYSTVYLYITEVHVLTPQVEPGAGERIRQGFADNVVAIGSGIKNFVIEFIIFIPYLILLGILAVIVVFLYKKINKISNERYEKRKAERQKKQEEAAKKAEEVNGEPKQL